MPIYYDEKSGSTYHAFVDGEPGEGPYKVVATPTENACIKYTKQGELFPSYGEPGEAVEVDCVIQRGRVLCNIGVVCADDTDEMLVRTGVIPGYETFGIQSVVATPSIPQLSAKFPVSVSPAGKTKMSLDALTPNTTYSITITPTANAILPEVGTQGQPATIEVVSDEDGAAKLSIAVALATGTNINGELSVAFGMGGGGGPNYN